MTVRGTITDCFVPTYVLCTEYSAYHYILFSIQPETVKKKKEKEKLTSAALVKG